MTNTERCRLLSARRRAPKFALGQLVREPHGDVGVVDKIFADLDAAHDANEIVDADAWYRVQSKRPKTPKSGVWYGVLLYDKPDGSGGSCLVGEDDLTLVTS